LEELDGREILAANGLTSFASVLLC